MKHFYFKISRIAIWGSHRNISICKSCDLLHLSCLYSGGGPATYYTREDHPLMNVIVSVCIPVYTGLVVRNNWSNLPFNWKKRTTQILHNIHCKSWQSATKVAYLCSRKANKSLVGSLTCFFFTIAIMKSGPFRHLFWRQESVEKFADTWSGDTCHVLVLTFHYIYKERSDVKWNWSKQF